MSSTTTTRMILPGLQAGDFRRPSRYRPVEDDEVHAQAGRTYVANNPTTGARRCPPRRRRGQAFNGTGRDRLALQVGRRRRLPAFPAGRRRLCSATRTSRVLAAAVERAPQLQMRTDKEPFDRQARAPGDRVLARPPGIVQACSPASPTRQRQPVRTRLPARPTRAVAQRKQDVDKAKPLLQPRPGIPTASGDARRRTVRGGARSTRRSCKQWRKQAGIKMKLTSAGTKYYGDRLRQVAVAQTPRWASSTTATAACRRTSNRL